MELKIDRDIILRGVQKIQTITPLKGTKPILSCFLLEAMGTGIRIFATDYDMGMKIDIPAQVSVPGQICLPARVVYDILRELPEKSQVELVLEENNRLRLICMNSIFHVPGISASEFPPFPQFDTQQLYPLPVKALLDMFVKVNVAVPAFEQKLYNAPAGALFAVSERGIEMAGTDGHRMAYIAMEGVGLPIQNTIVIPKKLLDEFPRILPEKEEADQKDDALDTLKVGITTSHIIFSLPAALIFARLLENKFPDYKGPITVQNDKLVIIDRDRFKQAVRRVSLIGEKKEWFILFKLVPDKLILDAESTEIGDAHDEVEAEYRGEPLEIGFNPKYILDFLAVIDTPEVALEMSDNESLAIMRPREKENVKFIIMPVRL